MTAHQRNLSAAIDPVKLDRLAEVAIKVGLRLQPGQDLLLTAPAVSLPLVRRITEHAYKAGAGLVTTFFSDEELTLARYRFGHDPGFDRAAGWLYEGMAKAFSQHRAASHRWRQSDAAVGRRPGQGRARQQGQFDGLSAGAGKDRQFRNQLEHHRLSRHDLGEAAFPDNRRGLAVAKLADAIFAASRVDRDGAVAAWEKHNAVLRERTEWLNGQRFHALKYSGPGWT